jgi:hypothetical protein
MAQSPLPTAPAPKSGAVDKAAVRPDGAASPRAVASLAEPEAVLASTAGRSQPPQGSNWLTMGLGAASLIQAVVIAFLIYSRPVSVAGIVGDLPLPAIATAAPVDAMPAPAAVAGPVATAAAVAPVAAAQPVARPSAAEAAPPAGSSVGGIRVTSPIELQVLENGNLVGSTAGPIAVNDGSHTFELVNEALGFRLRQTVAVKPGQFTNLNVSVPNGRISINAAPWADVWIDGTAAGQTPLANLSLPIGSHEIVFRHPELGEQRQHVDVKVGGLTRVSAILQK